MPPTTHSSALAIAAMVSKLEDQVGMCIVKKLNGNKKYNAIRENIVKHKRLQNTLQLVKPLKADCDIIVRVANVQEHTKEEGNLDEETSCAICSTMATSANDIEEYIKLWGRDSTLPCHISRIRSFVRAWKKELVRPAKLRYEQSLILEIAMPTDGFLPSPIDVQDWKKIAPSKFDTKARMQAYVNLSAGLSVELGMTSLDLPFIHWTYALNTARLKLAQTYVEAHKVEKGDNIETMADSSYSHLRICDNDRNHGGLEA